MSNVYYQPEDFGLEIVAKVDIDEPYEFDTVVVFRDRQGDLWAAHDSGCSCPTPFEDTKYPNGMVQIRTLDDLRGVLKDAYDCRQPPATQVFDLQNKTRAALAAATTN